MPFEVTFNRPFEHDAVTTGLAYADPAPATFVSIGNLWELEHPDATASSVEAASVVVETGGVATRTPLLQTSFLPDLTQVYCSPLKTVVAPGSGHLWLVTGGVLAVAGGVTNARFTSAVSAAPVVSSASDFLIGTGSPRFQYLFGENDTACTFLVLLGSGRA
jgi:hypothetical protein